MLRVTVSSVICTVLVLAHSVVGAQQTPAPPLPVPDHANVQYGPHDRNVLDLWIAESDGVAPLVIYYHGGGFSRGDKRSINRELVRQLLGNGVSVAAANYRLTDTAPYPAQMHDAARALQFIRLHAVEYGIDPTRIGATGGSAGAGISQWLAFHDDLADPDNPDPLLRQSTRLTAIVPVNAQTSYDPRFIKRLMNTEQVHPALVAFFGMTSAADVDDSRFHALFEDSSPLNHLTADDPPVLVSFNQRNDPLPPNSSGGLHIHHPKFGFALKEKADELGVECTILLTEDHPEGEPIDKYVNFFFEKFGVRAH